MILPLLVAVALASPQDGEVDRILVRFQTRQKTVQSEEAYRRLLAEARIELETFVKNNPGHKDAPRAAYQIAETYLSARDVDRGLKLHPADERAVYARLYIAVTYQNEGKYDQAAELLRQVRKDNPGRKEAWGAMMQLAVLLHVQEKNAEARKTLEELIAICPDREPVDIARRHLAEYLKCGKPVPLFEDKDIEGRDTSIQALRGKVVVIYFFDPAGQSASSEAAFLRRAREDAARAGKQDDLQILGVSIGVERKEVPMYKALCKVDWTLLHDGKGVDGRLPRLFDVRSLPSLTVIDRQGVQRFFNIAGRDFRNGIAKLLEEK
jgi:tetratricopeptide (TPR) repeat protein